MNNLKIHIPKILVILFLFSVFTYSCKEEDENPWNRDDFYNNDTTSYPEVYYRGVDLSFQPEIEEFAIDYKDENGNVIDLLSFLKQKGVNLVRLRLWHTPGDAHSSIPEVISYAKRIHSTGIDFMLDIHYSDTWADPGNQTIPQAWSGLTHDILKDSIYNYTKYVVDQFKAEGITPKIIQIGNETNTGFLWNLGRVGGSYDNNWNNYADLIKSAISAINNTEGEEDILTMIHFAGMEGASWFYNQLKEQSVNYDLIGLSYYSFWHTKDLNSVKEDLNSLATQYSKGIMIVETAYPWTLEWYDWTHNLVGEEGHLISGYEATPAGQLAYMNKINEILVGINNDKGMGFIYWAPDWVAYKGDVATDASSWENMAIFDFEFKVLPVIDAFKEPE